MLRELLTGAPESVDVAGVGARRARHPRLRHRGAPGAGPGPREGPGAEALRRSARPRDCRSSSPRPPSWSSTSTSLDRRPEPARLPRADRHGGADAPGPRPAGARRAARAVLATSSSTSTRTPTPPRSRCCRRSPATAATWSWSATRTSRSTPSAAPRCAASSSSPSASPSATAGPPDASCSAPPAASARAPAASASRWPRGSPLPGSVPAEVLAAFLHPRRPTPAAGPRGACSPSTPTGPRPSTSPTCCAAPTSRTAWPGRDMAVLVRSGRATIPALRRALAAAGVPVEVAARRHAAGARAGRRSRCWTRCAAVVHHDVEDPHDPAYVDAQRAQALLASPLAGLDAADVRRLARRLRAREKAAAAAEGRSPRASAELLRDALLDPGCARRGGRPAPGQRRAAALAALLRRRPRAAGRRRAPSRRCSGCCGPAPAGPSGCARRPDGGGPAARLAHRDLDAICALFETAARAEDAARPHRRPARSWRRLVAQQIPADTLAERGVRGDAVRLLTAHRAKGLEWPLVVVAHVQEEPGPTCGAAATLLRADRIGSDRAGAAGHGPRAARRGAAAVLRRLHPRPASGWW